MLPFSKNIPKLITSKIINGKYFLHDNGFTIISIDCHKLLDIYLWNYLLLIKSSIYRCSREMIQTCINMDKFKK